MNRYQDEALARIVETRELLAEAEKGARRAVYGICAATFFIGLVLLSLIIGVLL